MCGIAGIASSSSAHSVNVGDVVTKMLTQLAHRGPDDEGVWVDSQSDVALGHRRLSIIDPTSAGHQPMMSSDGRFVVTFNGELYNYLGIRKDLEKDDRQLKWRSSCDTEVLLEAVRIWGFEKALGRFAGMFAFAIWDKVNRKLTVARDRLGEKPLYFGWIGTVFCFASELKAFRAVPNWCPRIDDEGVEHFFRLGCVPAPGSIFQSISKLEPGCLFELSLFEIAQRRAPQVRRYWRLPRSATRSQRSTIEEEHDLSNEEQLEHYLSQAVRRQLVADVPVGAFLSGGIDSSAIVAFSQPFTERRLQTYTVAFHESHYSEASYARGIAEHLGTDHTELYVTARDALDVVPQLPTIYDEPLSDPSQIPTFLVSKLASRYVKVCLSGDGGDELFGGYNRHIWGARIPRWFGWIPLRQRKMIAGQAMKWLARTFEQNRASAFRREFFFLSNLQKLREVFCANDAREAYALLTSHWKIDERLIQPRGAPALYVSQWDETQTPEREMMHLDASWYLPDDILVKLDRAAMAVSLETRAPFLDHELVEFASTVPTSENIGLFVGKKLLRRVLYKRVPKHLVDRPKMGFALPVREWLAGPLRDWVEHLISTRALARHGLLNEDVIRAKWTDHQSGRHDWSAALWDVITFQAWYQEYFQPN
jgi:asparagine synthase (glutamine-hydrolysing)